MADQEATSRDWGLATRALHVGQGPDDATGAVVVPIHMATTYRQDEVGVHHGFEYSRSNNPTRQSLEECLASLEGARHCLTFASGLAATTTAMLLLAAGDHVVLNDDVYGGTARLFNRVLARYGYSFTAVDARDPEAVHEAIHYCTHNEAFLRREREKELAEWAEYEKTHLTPRPARVSPPS